METNGTDHSPDQNNFQIDSIVHDPNMPFTKYNNLEVPTIFLKDIESYEEKGWRQQYTNQSEYFNYGIFD
jgi:hypothetical protein